MQKTNANIIKKKTTQLKNGSKTLSNISPKKLYRWQMTRGKGAPDQMLMEN